MTDEQEKAYLLSSRYLSADGKPIPFPGGGAAPAGPDASAPPARRPAAAGQPLDLTAFGQEYKRLPVRMVFKDGSAVAAALDFRVRERAAASRSARSPHQSAGRARRRPAAVPGRLPHRRRRSRRQRPVCFLKRPRSSRFQLSRKWSTSSFKALFTFSTSQTRILQTPGVAAGWRAAADNYRRGAK